MAPVQIRCPTCDREITWSADSPYRPFCSERCRLIDLGEWLSERRAIPGESGADDPDNPDAAIDRPDADPRGDA